MQRLVGRLLVQVAASLQQEHDLWLSDSPAAQTDDGLGVTKCVLLSLLGFGPTLASASISGDLSVASPQSVGLLQCVHLRKSCRVVVCRRSTLPAGR